MENNLEREANKLEQVLESKLKPHRIKFNVFIKKCENLANELQMDWDTFIDVYFSK